ncbi:MAG: NUDIX hydrolase [Methanocorpusculum sp.]|nr:NUDIX hydrolase [Methanocorpusculum sp.]MDE2521634.1 NUDIX hydrolase [Methanocorpusculum sp.]MDE2525265.1 NUDIX hydrolase [Methanocorpusculum sp.]
MPILYDTSRLKIETKPVHLPNGRDREYLFVQPVSAVCILPTDEKAVYLIRQYRAVIDAYIYEVPAGGMESEDCDPIDAARRELAEEARFAAGELIPRGFVYSSPGFCTEKLWLFEARDLSVCEEFPRDEDEIIEVVRVAKEDAMRMVMDGRICDAKTIALLMRCLY